jgi:hypothetical protein
LLLVGIVVFCGCGTHSNVPSGGALTNVNAPSPSAIIEASQQTTEEANAVRLVGASVESNNLNVTSSDLRAKKNPKGAGVFVYVRRQDCLVLSGMLFGWWLMQRVMP